MSTRCVLIARSGAFPYSWDGNLADLFQMYRHCDGYPEGMGRDICEIMRDWQEGRAENRSWTQALLAGLAERCSYEIEPMNMEHGDLEYIYILEEFEQREDCFMAPMGEKWHILRVYKADIAHDKSMEDTLKRKPLFIGTPDEVLGIIGAGKKEA